MAETLNTLFLKSFDNHLSIINDDGTLSSDFKRLLSEHNIVPDDNQLRFLLTTVEDESQTVIDEDCNEVCNILKVNDRLFSLTFFDNGQEFYSSKLEEVVAVQKTITVYESI